MAKGKESASSIRKDLLDQLECAGSVGAQYRDLVEDYIRYYEIKTTLQADIKERGAKVSRLDSRGQRQIVNNESIDQLLKIHASMLKIHESLNVSGASAGADADDL